MRDWMTLLARGLAVLWAAFWLWFFVVESLAWHTPVAVMAPWVGAGVLFVLLAIAAWRWERRGGLLLAGVGLVAGLAYAAWSATTLTHLPVASRALTVVVLGVPPILAGTLFVLHHRAVGGPGHAAGPIARA